MQDAHCTRSAGVFTVVTLACSTFCVAQPTVLYRINAGGPQLSAADGSSPAWSEDSAANPSPYSNHAVTDVATRSVSLELDASVPAEAPADLFQTERYGPMQWELPVAAGLDVEVCLFFAETYTGITGAGQRVFDVTIEGQTVLDGFDLYAEYGRDYGVMKAFPVTVGTDGKLDIEFTAVVENPLVNGIEVVTYCSISGSGWQNASFTAQAALFQVEYDATPLASSIDGLTALSREAGTTFSDYAVLVRFNLAGTIDARDGDSYTAASVVSYTAGTTYHFRVAVDPGGRQYWVYVSWDAVSELLLAACHFRTEQGTTSVLANWGVWCGTGSHEVCRFHLSPYVHNITRNTWHSTIQAAIDGAANGDEIVLGRGTHTGPGNRDVRFNGKSITVRSEDPDDAEVVSATVIDCGGSESEPHRGFVFTSGEGPSAVLSGVTVINGYAPLEQIAGRWTADGGAILCVEASPTIDRCTIAHSRAGDGRDYDQSTVPIPEKGGNGGGIACYSSSIMLSSCTVTDNQAGTGGDGGGYGPYLAGADGGHGGGVYFEDSTPTIANSTLRRNVGAVGGIGDGMNGVCTGRGGDGGGFYALDSSRIVMIDCAIEDNKAGQGGACIGGGWEAGSGGHGGGGAVVGSSIQFSNCNIHHNTAGQGGTKSGAGKSGDGGSGGGVAIVNASASILDCQLSDNHGGSGGLLYGWSGTTTSGNGGNAGAVLCAGSAVTIARSLFKGNMAGPDSQAETCGGDGGSGGAVFCNSSSTLEVVDTLFHDNLAGRGGIGIDEESGGNGGDGGAICGNESSLTLAGCAFTSNQAGDAGYGEYGPGTGGSGGAISVQDSSGSIQRCIVVANQSGAGSDAGDYGGDAGDGGAIHLGSDGPGTLLVQNSLIASNSTGRGGNAHYYFWTGSGGNGGGMYCGVSASYSVLVKDCYIVGNRSADGGDYISQGGEYSRRGGNGGSGGGFYCSTDTSSVVVEDSLVCGNVSGNGGSVNAGGTAGDGGNGGGVCCVGQGSTFANCTICDNAAGHAGTAASAGVDGAGGGVHGVASISNAILWNNEATAFPQMSDSVQARYSCIQGLSGDGVGNISDSPMFVPGDAGTWTSAAVYDGPAAQTVLTDASKNWSAEMLAGNVINVDLSQSLCFVIADNTETAIIVWGDASGVGQSGDAYRITDYHLQSASRCVNGGDPSLDYEGHTDVDGNPRVQNCLPDMGAYESSFARYAAADFNQDCYVDASDLDHLMDCALGPAIAQTDPACGNANLNGDGLGAIDQNDFAVLQRCWTAEVQPASPDCAE